VTDVAQLFSDLVRAETRLYNAVDARLRATHGLSAGQYELMQIIADREHCRVYDIVQEVAITVGAASKAVDRLEAAGWCRRSANPDDRRSSLLSLTAAGSRLLAKARPTFLDEVGRRTGGVVTARALQQTATTLAALRAALEGHQREPHAG
jgi:DNA-binding MarR family transcriptional regulator